MKIFRCLNGPKAFQILIPIKTKSKVKLHLILHLLIQKLIVTHDFKQRLV